MKRDEVVSGEPRLLAIQGSDSGPLDNGRSEREVLIDEAVALFNRRYRRTIGREDARQMMDRLTGFFSLLSEWSGGAADAAHEREIAA